MYVSSKIALNFKRSMDNGSLAFYITRSTKRDILHYKCLFLVVTYVTNCLLRTEIINVASNYKRMLQLERDVLQFTFEGQVPLSYSCLKIIS